VCCPRPSGCRRKEAARSGRSHSLSVSEHLLLVICRVLSARFLQVSGGPFPASRRQMTGYAMRASVRAEGMICSLGSDDVSFRIPVELRYDSCDPYAVRLTFHLPGDAPVTWAFGRELLVDGVVRPCGEGDVRVAPVEPDALGEVLVRLQVGSDQALFRSSTAPLVAFLDRTDKLVPLGQEGAVGDFAAHLDDALGRILAEQSAG